MKRVLSIASAAFTLSLIASLGAQTPAAQTPAGQTPAGQTPAAPAQAPAKIGSDADYMAHMKEIGQLNGQLNKAIKGGMAEEAQKAAVRLEVLFKNIHGYWNMKKIDDATTAAQTAVTSLQAVQKALAANDMAAAETARATYAGTCMTCHTAHREKTPEGGWRIK